MTKSGKHCGKRRNCSFCSRQLFENMATKVEITKNEQFLPFCHLVFKSIQLMFLHLKGVSKKEIRCVFKVVCCRVVACGKGLKQTQTFTKIKYI